MFEGSGNLLSADKVATTQYFQVEHYLGECEYLGGKAQLSFSKNMNQNIH